MEGLNERIRDFYDQSTPLWLDTWGEQMHHGYYGLDGRRSTNHQQAQIDMIEELLAWGGATAEVGRFLDAGCGVGGSSRHLARKYPGAEGLGVTLSPVQAARGNAYNAEAGMSERLRLIAKNMYTLDPAAEGTFDLIWSMESAEHMADKAGLFALFYRLLRPGGRLVMATWCHRPEPPYLSPSDQYTLQQICALYHLPPLVSIPHLEEAANASGLTAVRTDDWSAAVEPFWGAVIRSGLDPRNWPGLVRSGMGTIKGAWAMKYMRQGFASGAIQYGVLSAERGR